MARWLATCTRTRSIAPPSLWPPTATLACSAAQILGRVDLASGSPDGALGVLHQEAGGDAIACGITRLRINALLAEAVSLNTLGLRTEAVPQPCWTSRKGCGFQMSDGWAAT
jgi:hypothetical protein